MASPKGSNRKKRKSAEPSPDVKINVKVGGDVSGSINVAAHDLFIAPSNDAETLARLFELTLSRLDTLESANPQDIADAKATIAEIEDRAVNPESLEENWLAQRFRTIARMGSDILDVATAALAGPGPAAAAIIRKVAAQARKERGLGPVS